MQATTTSVPLHIKLEIERRPFAARRVGLVVPPAKEGMFAQPPQVKESDLQVHAMEATRRPVAALRQGLLVRDTERKDVPSHDFQATDAHRMELDRRPIAALRQGHVAPPAARPDAAVLARAGVPLRDSEWAALEAARRPAAALRSGLAVDHAAVPPTPAAAAAIAAAAAPAKAFGATAAGAMEARRRLAAAARLGMHRADEQSAAGRAVVALDLDLMDSAYYAMEASRRPRAMARTLGHRGSASTNDLAALAAAAAAAAVERETAAARADNGVNVAKMMLDKNGAVVAAGAASGASEGPNPFASLERMLESRLSSNNLVGMGGGGRKSRGSSLRGAANYPGAAGNLSRGSSLRGAGNYAAAAAAAAAGNMQRCGSGASLAPAANNAVTRHVSCAVDEKTGEVVCRVDDSGDVVMSCHPDDAGMRCEFPAPTRA